MLLVGLGLFATFQYEIQFRRFLDSLLNPVTFVFLFYNFNYIID